MLWAYNPCNFNSRAHSGPFTLVSPNYNALNDLRPGVKCLFTQTSGGSQTLTFTMGLDSTSQGEINVFPNGRTQLYQYLILGVVNIGNTPYQGQLTGSIQCTFTLNGKWGASGPFGPFTAQMGPTGYASCWVVIPKSAIVGSTTTSQLTLAMTGNFVTSFGNFGIGEIIVAGADDLPLQQINNSPADPTRLNRASGNSPWPVLRRPFRKFNGVLIPTTREANMAGFNQAGGPYSRTIQDMIFTGGQVGGHIIAPLWRQAGYKNSYQQALMQENAYMARLLDPLPTQVANASENMFNNSFNFEELY